MEHRKQYMVSRLGFMALCLWLSIPLRLFSAEYPQWWIDRGVVNTNSAMTNDFAVVNAGQLRWMAANAFDEMNLHGGASQAISNFVSGFTQSNNYAVVNRGQLKYAASLFYNRLAELNNQSETNYPWPDVSLDCNDYAGANIGQIKYLFSFEFTNGCWKSPVSCGLSNEMNAKIVFSAITNRTWSGPTNSVVLSNSITLNMSVYTNTGLAKYYLSSLPGSAGGWSSVTGLIVKMIDENGTFIQTFNPLPASDSIDITSYIPSNGKFSLLLIYTDGGTIGLGSPVCLVSWLPVLSLSDENFGKVLGYNCLAVSNFVSIPLSLNGPPPHNGGFSFELSLSGKDISSNLTLATQNTNVIVTALGYDSYYVQDTRFDVSKAGSGSFFTNLYYTRAGIEVGLNNIWNSYCYWCTGYMGWYGGGLANDVQINIYPTNFCSVGTLTVSANSLGDIANDTSVTSRFMYFSLGNITSTNPDTRVCASWNVYSTNGAPGIASNSSYCSAPVTVGADLTATPTNSSQQNAFFVNYATKVKLDYCGILTTNSPTLFWGNSSVRVDNKGSGLTPAYGTEYHVTSTTGMAPKDPVTINVSTNGWHNCPQQLAHCTVTLIRQPCANDQLMSPKEG